MSILYLTPADISGHNLLVDDCNDTTVATVATVAGGTTHVICQAHVAEPDPPPKTPQPKHLRLRRIRLFIAQDHYGLKKEIPNRRASGNREP